MRVARQTQSPMEKSRDDDCKNGSGEERDRISTLLSPSFPSSASEGGGEKGVAKNVSENVFLPHGRSSMGKSGMSSSVIVVGSRSRACSCSRSLACDDVSCMSGDDDTNPTKSSSRSSIIVVMSNTSRAFWATDFCMDGYHDEYIHDDDDDDDDEVIHLYQRVNNNMHFLGRCDNDLRVRPP